MLIGEENGKLFEMALTGSLTGKSTLSNMADGFRHHLVAGARDIVVVVSAITILSGIAVAVTKPFWEPFANVPRQIAEMQIEQERQGIVLSSRLEPHIVEFEGKAQVIGPKVREPGQEIVFLYFLKRNATCETTVIRRFYNVETGRSYIADEVRAEQSPVTDRMNLFRVATTVPDDLPDGFYVYSPSLLPEQCGIYGRMEVIPSEIFEVRRGD